MPSKGQCNAARSTVDVEHHAARYFYDQVLIDRPTDLSFPVETDSDMRSVRSLIVASGEQRIIAAVAGLTQRNKSNVPAIVVTLGGLAQQHATRMARLAVGIYDNSFIGMSYVAQAREAFVHLAEENGSEAAAAPSHLPRRGDVERYLIAWMLRSSVLLRAARAKQGNVPGHCFFS